MKHHSQLKNPKYNIMDKNKGYVYVLMNPSYSDIVKVGKTTKNPEERAKELSSVTGIATPFVVVYKRLFKNCHAAEKIVHDILTERGYRVNDMREFFSVETSEAIDVIQQIPDDESPEYMDGAFVDNEDLSDNVTSSGNENLGEAYFNKAEDYYYGRDDTFEDQDKALFYYEKSAALGYSAAYEMIGDIWENKGNTKKAVFYYTKAVDSYNSMCYAKLGKIYMDKYGESYNSRNALLAWSKYFEYLERHKDNLLTASDYSAYSVGFNINSYFNNYLISGTSPQEHENFVVRNKTGLILVLTALDNTLKNLGRGEYISKKINNHILPYLYGLPNTEDEEEILKIQDVHDYYFGRNGKEKNIEKALRLYKKQVANGNIIGDIYVGICHYNFNQVAQTDKAWKEFYNHVYELLEAEGKNLITPESSKALVDAFHQMFEYAVRAEITELIHDYYILAALKLGYLEYVAGKMQETSERFDSMTEAMNNLKKIVLEAPLAQLLAIEGFSEKLAEAERCATTLQTEKDNLANTYTFVRGRIAGFQERYDGNSELMMYRLED